MVSKIVRIIVQPPLRYVPRNVIRFNSFPVGRTPVDCVFVRDGGGDSDSVVMSCRVVVMCCDCGVGRARDSDLGGKSCHNSHNLLVRRSKDGTNVGVESHAPEANSSHELFRALQLAVASEDGIDKFAAAVLAHGDLFRVTALLLGRFPHVVLADFEELVEALP
jgi:hypothetical protein